MHPFRTYDSARRLGTATAMLAALASAAPACAADLARAPRQGGAAPLRANSSTIAPKVTLSEGKSTLMRLPFPAARMSVGDARVADVILLNPTELYLLGKSVGSTNLILWNKAGDATIIDVAVDLDTSALAARFEQLLAGEKDVKISTAADSVILSGVVSDTVKLDQMLSLANAYAQRGGQGGAGGGDAAATGASGGALPKLKVINMVSVAAPQQVMLEVKVAEISKTLIDQLGASIGASKTNGSWTYSFLSNLLSGNPSMGDAFNSRNGNFLTIDAQKRDGLVKVLAEPNIMAISGQEASFLAGGKIFIPVSQVQNNGIPTITLEEKEFGVAVKFTPTVLEGGRINLKVAPEVSDLNKEGVGITATGISGTAILPSFTTRRATTTVQLYDGQSFAIGGLIKNNVTTDVKAFPMLGEIPVLGALFRSSQFQTDRSELVFIITPRLVKPLPADYRLPTDDYVEPSRSEFFLGGRHAGKPRTEPATQAKASAASGFELK
jgi:pilus assembly protein CpaC